MRALAILLITLALAAGGSAFGGEELATLERDARERAEELQARVERLADRIREQLERIRRAVPSASRPQPATEGRTEPGTIDGFLTETLSNVDGFWTRTLEASGLPEPRVGFSWPAPGTVVASACGAVADDSAAFYCALDDTIYVGQAFASAVWAGTADAFPGQRAGYGRAIGDFGLAYVVAHEYAHNLQHELGSRPTAARTCRRRRQVGPPTPANRIVASASGPRYGAWG